jgi:acyl-CoA synthetase (AMP-forming)/AMP-acid ligase II
LWQKIVDFCGEKGVQLPSLKRLFVAGASVPPNLLEGLKKTFPNAEIHTPYGATEALPIASFSDRELLNKDIIERTLSGHGTCVGKPLPQREIGIIPIVDGVIASIQEVAFLPENQVGEIVVKGPVVTEAYDQLIDETRLAKIPAENGTFWHRMGDLGYLDSAGRLWFCGRKIERVDAPGGTFYTDCCENIFNQHPQIKRSALIALRISHNLCLPAIVIQPKSAFQSQQRKGFFINELHAFAKKFPVTRNIEHFFLCDKFPVDVRHNTKIHRLKMSRVYSDWFLRILR